MKSEMYEAEKAGIERLRKADIEATLRQDPGEISILWADDGINLQTPGAPTIGVNALKAFYEKFRSEYPEFKVVEYAPEFRELQIVEGWAIEVIDANATFRLSANGEAVRAQPRLVRVLKRQDDGAWKFALVSPG